MTITLILPLFTGAFVGLIINYLADVLPVTRSFSQPTCHKCGVNLSLVDFILMRHCSAGHARSLRAWVVLIIEIAASLHIWLTPPTRLGYMLGLLLAAYFSLIFVIDQEHRLILHPTSIFGAILGILIGVIKRGITYTLLGALGGFLIMFFFYLLGALFSKYRRKRMAEEGHEADDEEALGGGDVILITILGLMLGWPVIWFALLTGIMLGGLASISILAWLVVSRQYDKNSMMMFIPYGPFFITSASVIIFFPNIVSKILTGS